MELLKKKMKVYFSKSASLRITRVHSESSFNNAGKKVTKPAKYIQFENGKFIANDSDEIEFMDKYMETGHNSNLIINLKDEQLKILELNKTIADNRDNLDADSLKAIADIVEKAGKVKGTGKQGPAGA